MHYVSFNLAGSALFLIAVSLLYGVTGTLNMADLAQRVPQLPAPTAALLLQSAALLLLVVFGVKAALLPLYFWLPATYGAASAPVAALFAIMTKVGVYAVLRVTTLVFGADGGAAAHVTSPWLPRWRWPRCCWQRSARWPRGSCARWSATSWSPRPARCCWPWAWAGRTRVAAGLFYLVNSTLVAAALFLLADRIARRARRRRRPAAAPPRWAARRAALGVLFFIVAVAVAGVPPLAGFMGKALLLQAAGRHRLGRLGRGGGAGRQPADDGGAGAHRQRAVLEAADAGERPARRRIRRDRDARAEPTHAAHGVSLALLALLLAACARARPHPLSRYTAGHRGAALRTPRPIVRAVLGAQPVPAAFDVRREMRERKESRP